MEPGLKLKAIRERLGLRYREVEAASNQIAQRHKNPDFAIGLSRLADMENKGVLPNIHRLYTLCAIYRLDFNEVLGWYGIDLNDIWRDASHLRPERTHLANFRPPAGGAVSLPLMLDPGVDFSETVFLSRIIQQWGEIPLSLLETLDLDSSLYGFIGWEDRRMYPLLRPGALVQIDPSRDEIVERGWKDEFDRPIYFVETRGGYACCWCSQTESHVVLQAHSASGEPSEVLELNEVSVVGQVRGIAMQLELQPDGQVKSKTKARRPRQASVRE